MRTLFDLELMASTDNCLVIPIPTYFLTMKESINDNHNLPLSFEIHPRRNVQVSVVIQLLLNDS
jgi:hypothetical protein